MRKLFHSLLLILGVTFLSFVLMVYFGPDQTYTLLGKNATGEQIQEIRHQLGYDQPFLVRYGQYVRDLFTLQLGASNSSGESVTSLLKRTLPITLALIIPGFILGNLLGVVLGLIAAANRNRFLDHLITGASVAGMSISFLIIIIVLQILLCTPYGLNLFPVRGWQVTGISSYLYYTTVPTLALVLISLGYNTRFFRTVFVEESNREHILAARAFGASPIQLMGKHVLKNSLIPILTRILFSIPLIIISGSLLLETYFGIPGVGRVTFDAITNGDQPVLKSVVGLTAVLFVLIQLLADFSYRLVDPRVS